MGATVVFGDFEWDAAKADSNLAKHGVTFEEASTVFADERSESFPDGADIERFLLLGMSQGARVLVVVHAERGARIRIISARKATRHERSHYEH